MVKVEFKEKFNPVNLILETREEFDFLYELLNAGEGTTKEDCDKYSSELNTSIWNALYEIKNKLT
jgi:hypothetical protein